MPPLTSRYSTAAAASCVRISIGVTSATRGRRRGDQRRLGLHRPRQLRHEVDRLVRRAPTPQPLGEIRPPPAAPTRLGRLPQPWIEAPDDVGVDVLDATAEERVPLPLRQAGDIRRRRPEIERRRPALDDPRHPHLGRQPRQHPLPAPAHRVEVLRRPAVDNDGCQRAYRDQLAGAGQAGPLVDPPPVRQLVRQRPRVARHA